MPSSPTRTTTTTPPPTTPIITTVRRRNNNDGRRRRLFAALLRPTSLLGSIVGCLLCGWLWILFRMHHQQNQHQDTMAATSGSHDDSSPKRQQHRSIKEDDVTTLKSTSTSSSSSPPRYHVVFSTGCSVFQDWQSYLFFYQAWKSGQPGTVTRIVSGCKEGNADLLLAEHKSKIQSSMAATGDAGNGRDQHRFRVHFTPDYASSVLPGVNYKFFNKPFGLRHWMEHELGYRAKFAEQTNVHDDDVIIVLDPDQGILRPLTADYTNERELWQERDVPTNRPRVQRGKPMAQLYGMGSNWKKGIDMQFVLNYTKDKNNKVPHAAVVMQQLKQHLSSETGQLPWTSREVELHYAGGPPYLATGLDMYKIVRTWADVVVPVYQLTTNHLSEMFAWSVAAAVHDLPNTLAQSFMVSAASQNRGEGWGLVQNHKSLNDVCAAVDYLQDNDGGNNNQTKANNEIALPHVMHYCQRYFVGPYFFSKYKLPKNFMTDCGHPLLAVPEDWEELFTKHTTAHTPDNQVQDMSKDAGFRRRHATALCWLLPPLNAAATHYKRNFCNKNETEVNLERSYFFPKDKVKIKKKATTAITTQKKAKKKKKRR